MCNDRFASFQIGWPGPDRQVLVYKFNKGKYDLYDTIDVLEGTDYVYTDLLAVEKKRLKYRFRVKDTVKDIMYPYSEVYKVVINEWYSNKI